MTEKYYNPDSILECLANILCGDCNDKPDCKDIKHCCNDDCSDSQYICALADMSKLQHMNCHDHNPIKTLIDILIENLMKCEYNILIKYIDNQFIVHKTECDQDVINVTCNTIIRNNITDITIKTFCNDICTVIVIGQCAIKKNCNGCNNKCQSCCCKSKHDCKKCYNVLTKLDYAKKICNNDTSINKFYTKILTVLQIIFGSLELRIMDDNGNKLFQVKLNNQWYTTVTVFIINDKCDIIIIARFCIETIVYVLQNKS